MAIRRHQNLVRIQQGLQPVQGSFTTLPTTMALWWGSNMMLIDRMGKFWGIGANSSGQLGNNSITAVTTKWVNCVKPGAVFSMIVYEPTWGVIGLDPRDGSAWCWGYGGYGQLGNGQQAGKSSPVSVLGGNSWKQITGFVTNSNAALRASDGSFWGWGYNAQGQLGNNLTANVSSPVSAVGGISFIQICMRGQHSVGIAGVDGSAWGWGNNITAQLGDDTTTTRSSPVSVLGGNSYTYINSETLHTVAIRGDGTGWSWGYNSLGQLGTNNITSYSSPVSIVGGRTWLKLVANNDWTLGLASDNLLYGWGANAFGKCGHKFYFSPENTITDKTWSSLFTGIAGYHIGAIQASDGIAYCWGYNNAGQTGDNSTIAKSSPVSVLGGNSFKQLCGGQSFTMAIRGADGIAFGWGINTSGQIGSYSHTNVSSPISTAGGISFTQLICGVNHAMGINGLDGTLWAWGYNPFGQLGDSSTTTKSSPISVVGGYTFSKLAVTGNAQGYGIQASDGIGYAWGSGVLGLLGNNTTTSTSSPVSVVGGNSFTHISGGGSFVIAIAGVDGSAWCWGNNGNGQLGDDTTTTRSSPVSVLGGNSFIQISAGWNHALGLLADGTVRAWGANYTGTLGDASSLGKSSPISVLGNHSFIQVLAASSYSYGLKSDGTMWFWGDNWDGNAGNNKIESLSFSSPVCITTARSFIDISSIDGTGYALEKGTGIIFSWGYNVNQEGGRLIPDYQTSPTAIDALFPRRYI